MSPLDRETSRRIRYQDESNKLRLERDAYKEQLEKMEARKNVWKGFSIVFILILVLTFYLLWMVFLYG